MTEIKSAIKILCEHLNLLFALNLKPEQFRLAKFNKSDDNVGVFWNVLNKFAQDKLTDDVVNNAKMFIHSLGYNSLEFYCLPSNCAGNSRELLLALGFILGKGFLSHVINKEVQMTPFHESYILQNEEPNNQRFIEKQLKSHLDKLNATKWMKGKIAINERIIQEVRDGSNKLLKKINLLSPIGKVENLSANEILALEDKDLGNDLLVKSERIINILENQEKWMKKEKIFWEWMNSVLVEKNKNQQEVNCYELKKFYLLITNT